MPRIPRISPSARAPSSRSRTRSRWRARCSRRADLESALAGVRGRALDRSAEDPERRAQLDRMVRERQPVHGVRGRAVRVQPADAQPAHFARESARARSGVRGAARNVVRGRRTAADVCRTADVHAVHAARRHAQESRRRVADGAVLVRRRHAGRLLPRASRQPRARRRGARVHRDGVRGGRRAHLAGMRRHVRAGADAAWRRIVDYVHARTSAKIAIQLGHAGPKGSTQLGWEDADEPLPLGQLAADRAVRRSLRPATTRCRTR